jgi:hypothetical protein
MEKIMSKVEIPQLADTKLQRLQDELRGDEMAYVHSLGEHDAANLLNMAEFSGRTALRLVMGATTDMPLRALHYAGVALHLAQRLGVQAQIVHTNHVGAAVNHTALNVSNAQAELLNPYIQDAAEAMGFSGFVHAIDRPLDLAELEESLSPRLELSEQLERMGQRNGGNPAQYLLAHLAVHDTDLLELDPIAASAEPIRPGLIISVGAQSERPFYDSRMRTRRRLARDGIAIPHGVATAQIFTRHRFSPYRPVSVCEPRLTAGLPTELTAGTVGDRTARDDLIHLRRFLEELKIDKGGENE